MKKINLNEEFSCSGLILKLVNDRGVLKLEKMGEGRFRPEFIPPTLQEVKDYFYEEGYTMESAEKFYKSYSSNDWKDSNDKPVRAWRMKAINVWFVPGNKRDIFTTKTEMVR